MRHKERLGPKDLVRLAFLGLPGRHGAGADLNFSTAVSLPTHAAPQPLFIRSHEYEPLYSFIATGFAIFQGVLLQSLSVSRSGRPGPPLAAIHAQIKLIIARFNVFL